MSSTRYLDLKKQLSDFYSEANTQTKIKENHLKRVLDLDEVVKSKEEELEILTKAKLVLQKISDQRNSEAKEGVRELINDALNAVFQNNRYEILITDDNHGSSGKITKVELVELQTGKIRTPKYSNGTGVKQIISFLFIVALLEYASASRLVLLDETFSGLEGEFATLFGDIIVALAKNNNFQFLIVNHNDNLFTNENFKIINLELPSVEEGLRVRSIV